MVMGVKVMNKDDDQSENERKREREIGRKKSNDIEKVN
jgi:hypothetical protein